MPTEAVGTSAAAHKGTFVYDRLCTVIFKICEWCREKKLKNVFVVTE